MEYGERGRRMEEAEILLLFCAWVAAQRKPKRQDA
jgi:hypothetical protein